jgi:acyl carrier protein
MDLSRIRAIIARQLDVPFARVALDVGLDALEVDLVALAQLALALEDAFGIAIPDDDWLELTTVGEVVACVLDCRGAGAADGRPRA